MLDAFKHLTCESWKLARCCRFVRKSYHCMKRCKHVRVLEHICCVQECSCYLINAANHSESIARIEECWCSVECKTSDAKKGTQA